MPRFPITWRFLVRRGWMLGLGAIVGLAAAWAISGITVSATSALSVQTVGFYQPPYEDDKLALTYAQLLPEEPSVIRAVSEATALPQSYVRDHLTMSTLPETNLLIARFSASSEATAKAALDAFATATRTGSDAAGTKLRKTVRPLTEPTVRGGFSRSKGLALGALAGLALALSLALALERRLPRVDDRRDLARILPVPIAAGPPPGDLEPDAIVVTRGTPRVEVEEAFRSGRASGTAISSAYFVNRRPRTLATEGG